mgnify:CR=1 FL=1
MNQSVKHIPTDNLRVYAFEICGELSEEDLQIMAETMNEAFDKHEKVDMLLLFKTYDGTETGASLDSEVIKSRFRALANVDKYVVVGAPDGAQTMIDVMDKVIPVDAKTFDSSEIDQAWSSVNARPLKRIWATA